MGGNDQEQSNCSYHVSCFLEWRVLYVPDPLKHHAMYY